MSDYSFIICYVKLRNLWQAYVNYRITGFRSDHLLQNLLKTSKNYQKKIFQKYTKNGEDPVFRILKSETYTLPLKFFFWRLCQYEIK